MILLKSFGIVKETKTIETVDDVRGITGGMPIMEIKKEVYDAWVAAGMPDIDKFTEEYQCQSE